MSNLDLVKAALKNNMDKRVVHKPNVLAAEAKGTASKQAFEAVTGDLRGLDLDYLDSLNRIQGTLKNTYMESISANKITSGSILGTNLTLAGTEASNNKTTLTMIGDALMRVNDGATDRLKFSNAGIEISDSGNESADPASVIGRGIFNTGSHYAGLWPFNNPSRRGWNLRADGISGVVDGHIRIIATKAAAATSGSLGSWASVELNVGGTGPGVISGLAGAIIHNMLWVVGPARIGNAMDVTGTLTAKGNARILGSLTDVGNINMRSVGQYQSNGLNASFGGGIIATGTVKSNTGSITGQGLNIQSGGVALPANTIDGAMLKAHTSLDTERAVGFNHIRDNAVTNDKLADSSVDRRVIDMNDLLSQLDNRYAFKSQLHYH